MKRKGFTVLELLVALALIAGVLSAGFFSGRSWAQRERAEGFVPVFAASFWIGATEAAARGRQLRLEATPDALLLYQGTKVLRRWPIPPGFSVHPDGPLARFSPPGEVKDPNGNDLNAPLVFTLTTPSGTKTATVSVIGEVKVE